ncbi:Utp18 protein [Saccharomycopsis crataegensis]|uniref:Utp18 protein n=1 Tax=Saccharomycopsis crataegensis TaxID=43959 RepID=A0AAV5QQI8_9ASCO|nr:Utp18 protein [Saccharomycopsis crataegensis]
MGLENIRLVVAITILKNMDKKKSQKNASGKQQKNNKKQSQPKTQVISSVFKRPENVELPEKDEQEIELEKLVFGDAEGFESNLKDLDNFMNDSSDDEFDDDNNEGNFDGEKEEEEDVKMAGLQDDMLFFMDDDKKGQADANGDIEMKDGEESATDGENSDDDEEEAAWVDSDDERMNINLKYSSKIKKLRTSYDQDTINSKIFINRLRSQFEKIYPRPAWADEEMSDVDEKNSSDEDNTEPVTDDEGGEDIDRNSYNPKTLIQLVESSISYKRPKQPKLLTPKNINIARLKDANYKHLSQSAIQSINFHPELPLLLTGGYDRTLRIYHIDGKNNNVVTTLFFKNSPIQNAYFATPNNTNKVFLAGRRKFMYKLDLMSGEIEKITNLYGIKHLQKSFESFKISPLNKYIGLIGNNGYVNILSLANGSFVKNYKVDGVVADFVWSQTEQLLLIINTAGTVYEFDFQANEIVGKWQDENGLGITKLALGGKNDRYLAIGSNNGIVNVYDRLKQSNTHQRKPMGTIESLVTSISSLVFNVDGQLLCIASRAKKDSLRLVHIPSCSVYKNWPTSGTPLGKVTAVAFSKNSEMLAVGNEAGKARLFQLNDY